MGSPTGEPYERTRYPVDATSDRRARRGRDSHYQRTEIHSLGSPPREWPDCDFPRGNQPRVQAVTGIGKHRIGRDRQQPQQAEGSVLSQRQSMSALPGLFQTSIYFGIEKASGTSVLTRLSLISAWHCAPVNFDDPHVFGIPSHMDRHLIPFSLGTGDNMSLPVHRIVAP